MLLYPLCYPFLHFKKKKYIYLLSESVLTCMWVVVDSRRSWDSWDFAQLQLTISPPFILVMWLMLHACLRVWPSYVMKIPYVAHQTWLTLAVLTTYCSSRSKGLLRNTQTDRCIVPVEKINTKKRNVFVLALLCRYSVTGWTETWHVQSLWRLFDTFLPQHLKSPEN